MKKQILLLALALLGAQSMFKANPLNPDGTVNTQAFWHEAIKLFDKAGYVKGTPYGDHARENYERVKTMHQHKKVHVRASRLPKEIHATVKK